MEAGKFNVEKANEIDLVDYLEKAGHWPQKIRHNDYWYLSPLRTEKTPSFKINRAKNVWYDHGTGRGGGFIDFGILFHDCTVKELLASLNSVTGKNLSFQQSKKLDGDNTKNKKQILSKIVITHKQEIQDKRLVNYLQDRRIPLSIASAYCKQIEFELLSKKYVAVGFKNDKGGYEIRNAFFKGSSAPKHTTLIHQNQSKELAVFEGFFSFLSYHTILKSAYKEKICLPDYHGDYLILNSLSFFEKSKTTMDEYNKINLFLDRDSIGMAYTNKALQWSNKYTDQSIKYHSYKDLNDFLTHPETFTQKQNLKRGLRL